MRFSAVLSVVVAVASTAVVARPIAYPMPVELAVRQSIFPPTSYKDVQISSGTAGNAQAKAEQVCVAPFNGIDLATVDAASLKNLAILRKAAESAESDFNTAIDDATGAERTALQIGKSQNKVLKLTCLKQVNLIKQAQGSNTAAAIADSEAKLKKNIAADVAKAGQASKGIPDSPAAAASEAARDT